MFFFGLAVLVFAGLFAWKMFITNSIKIERDTAGKIVKVTID